MTETETEAPEGQVWFCMACGKKSPRKEPGHPDEDKGWDISCMANAALVYKRRTKGGAWIQVPEDA